IAARNSARDVRLRRQWWRLPREREDPFHVQVIRQQVENPILKSIASGMLVGRDQSEMPAGKQAGVAESRNGAEHRTPRSASIALRITCSCRPLLTRFKITPPIRTDSSSFRHPNTHAATVRVDLVASTTSSTGA